MSDKQGDYERIGSDQSQDAFEAVLSALRPRVDRSGRSEFIPFGPTTGTASSKCVHPAGHEFVCIYCGGAPLFLSRARRWAWPAALAAMTAAAAVLLALIISDRAARIALNETKPAAATANPTHLTDSRRPRQQADKTIASQVAFGRLAFRRHPGQILSVADVLVIDDLVASDREPRTSAVDRDKPILQMSDPATLRTLMSQFGVLEKTTN